MAEIVNKSVTDFFVSGGPNIGTATIDTSTIELRDGSASGAITFKFTAPLSGDAYYNGINPINFMLGNNYVLFDDGIHASSVGADAEGDNAVNGNTVTISFFYELG